MYYHEYIPRIMKQFINLTYQVINKSHITEILKLPGKYHIYRTNNSFSGLFVAGTGLISTDYTKIEICENKNKKDYDTITNFINKIDE